MKGEGSGVGSPSRLWGTGSVLGYREGVGWSLEIKPEIWQHTSASENGAIFSSFNLHFNLLQGGLCIQQGEE